MDDQSEESPRNASLIVTEKGPLCPASQSPQTTASSLQSCTPFWIHFLSGGIAGTIGAVVTCPLELVKTRFQSSHYVAGQVKWSFKSHPMKAVKSHVGGTLSAIQHIYRSEGLRALWKGVGATVVGVMPSRAIYFSAYQTFKSNLSQNIFDGRENVYVHLGAAVTAGIVTATATNPIWLIKTRIQLQSSPVLYKNSFDCLKRVVQKEGFFSLYQGLSASYLGCIEGTLQWVLYEKLKKSFSERRMSSSQSPGQSYPWADTLVAAAASKIVACTLTYPHEVLRTRLRQGSSVQRSSDGEVQLKRYSGLVNTISRIYKEEGIAAFYGGMTAHLLRVVPNSAIMFFCYEFFVYGVSKNFFPPATTLSQDVDEIESISSSSNCS